MRNNILLVILVAASSSVAPRPASCTERNGLDFAMSTDNKVYTVGEVVRVTFAWTNVSDRRLVIVNWRGPKGGVTSSGADPEKTYDFSVYYEGKDMLPYHGEFACGPLGSLNLEPNQTMTREYEISDVYSFERPGRYVIRAEYYGFAYDDRDSEHWRGKIIHPDVELWVKN